MRFRLGERVFMVASDPRFVSRYKVWQRRVVYSGLGHWRLLKPYGPNYKLAVAEYHRLQILIASAGT